jgi:prepilin-type N-terminal cleavage/methylation domain-containing protein
MREKQKSKQGFTLIELLVVIAVIGLLASLILVALGSSRHKARNAKRIGDMTQLSNGLELYYATYKGYPADSSPQDGVPDGLSPEFLSTMSTAPLPPDGSCASSIPPSPASVANTYYYVPAGNSAVIDGRTVWSSYVYYFCLGDRTGEFFPGLRSLTPTGVQ